MKRRFAMLTCMLLAVANTCVAQVSLEHKLREGSAYTKETSTRLNQKLVLAGMETDSAVDTRTISKSTVGKREADGSLRVQEKIESLQIGIDTMGIDYTFDSANPDGTSNSPVEFLREVHKAMAQRSTTLVFNKDNRVQSVECADNLLEKLPDEIQKLVKSQLDPENIKRTTNEELDQLPSQAVGKGDSWERTERINFGAGQVMTFVTKYQYEGTIEKDGRTLDKITGKVVSVQFGLEDSPLPLTLKGSDLKVSGSESTILFDRQLGMTVENQSSVTISGDILFATGGTDLPSKLELKIESSTAVRS